MKPSEIAQVQLDRTDRGLVVRDVKRAVLRLGCWATEFLIDELIWSMYLDRGLVRGALGATFTATAAVAG